MLLVKFYVVSKISRRNHELSLMKTCSWKNKILDLHIVNILNTTGLPNRTSVWFLLKSNVGPTHSRGEGRVSLCRPSRAQDVFFSGRKARRTYGVYFYSYDLQTVESPHRIFVFPVAVGVFRAVWSADTRGRSPRVLSRYSRSSAAVRSRASVLEAGFRRYAAASRPREVAMSFIYWSMVISILFNSNISPTAICVKQTQVWASLVFRRYLIVTKKIDTFKNKTFFNFLFARKTAKNIRLF